MKHCDYYGCDEPLASDQPETGMKFCVKHDAEFECVIKKENALALLKFWIEAQGGAEQAAKRMIDGEL